MRVLVTGGAGFIGSNLVRALGLAGHRVVVADNFAGGLGTRLLQGSLPEALVVRADVRSRADLTRLPAGPWDRIYHLAASFANALSIEDPELDMSTNVEGTTEVIELARRAGCGLLVYAASSSSYGDAPVPFREDGPMLPHTPYARSKLEGERRVLASGLPAASFRLFNVYGPGDTPGCYRNAIPNMIAALDGGGRIPILGTDATRDFTFVDDVVSVLLEAGRAAGHVVNVGTGAETPIPVLAELILGLFDLPVHRMRVSPPRPWDRVVRRAAATGELMRLFGRVPSTPLEVGLEATARWLHQHGFVESVPRSLRPRAVPAPPPRAEPLA